MIVFWLVVIAAGIFVVAKTLSGGNAERRAHEHRIEESNAALLSSIGRDERAKRMAERDAADKAFIPPDNKSDWS